MTTPGWYPDPAGQPGAFRYWDGQGWGADVTDNPNPGTPGGAPGPTPPPYLVGQPGPGASGGGAGKVVGLVALVVVLLVVVGAGAFFVVRSVTDDDADTASDDPTSQTDFSEPTEGPTDEPTDVLTEQPTEQPTEGPADPFADTVLPTQQQCAGGSPDQGATGAVGDQLTGGGLTMPQVPGFSGELNQSTAFAFADGVFAPSKVVERGETSAWAAVYALGGLTKSNGFTSPGEAAGVVLECMTRSQAFYEGFTGATLVDSRATTVDGADAWVMDAEVRVDDPELSVEGDAVKVIVVDTGDPERYGLFVSLVPIGDQTLFSQQQAQELLLSVG